MKDYKKMNIKPRLLLGPGPSNVPHQVLQALSTPLIGHLDPQFLTLMDGIKRKLKILFNTLNPFTLPISGTGSAGMEACFANLVDDQDKVLIGVNGIFGTRMAEVAKRYGGDISIIESTWGTHINEELLIEKAKLVKPQIIALVHAETSTGILQPLEKIGQYCHENNILFIVDCVTSLGGCKIEVDKWYIDAAYSGTQKCLNCPPGLSPVTFSPRAIEKINNRKLPVKSWYLDVSLLNQYWGQERVYHHTAPISMNYALDEALNIILEEGLEKRFKRHQENFKLLAEGLNKLGLTLAAEKGYELPSLLTIEVPIGLNEADLRKFLLDKYSIEVGSGLGPLKGKIIRIGLMGINSNISNIQLILSAFKDYLQKE